MKILQIMAPGKVEWRDAPIPEPGPGEVLVKILGVTTCPHWDMHLMEGVPMFPGGKLDYPYTPGQPGHEAVGEVVSLGSGVEGPAPGSMVAAWKDPGHQRQGCYAQYTPFQAEHLIEIPERNGTRPRVEQIAPLELAMCVQVSFDQLSRLDGVRGRRFGVSGLGPAGLIAVQMAKSYGAREVIGIDPLPERRALAASLGADIVLPPDGQTLPPGRSGPSALDAAIDCTGLKVSIEFLMERTRHEVAIFGVLRETVHFGPQLWSGGFALLGYGSHNRQAAERALQLVLDGQIDLAPLVTHQLPLSEYVRGVKLLRAKQAIKICFLPWE